MEQQSLIHVRFLQEHGANHCVQTLNKQSDLRIFVGVSVTIFNAASTFL